MGSWRRGPCRASDPAWLPLQGLQPRVWWRAWPSLVNGAGRQREGLKRLGTPSDCDDLPRVRAAVSPPPSNCMRLPVRPACSGSPQGRGFQVNQVGSVPTTTSGALAGTTGSRFESGRPRQGWAVCPPDTAGGPILQGRLSKGPRESQTEERQCGALASQTDLV